ncbi:glycosyltransferase family 4 protein [Puia sp.]|jgi:glycosyltransferase involved in cell wall biosynthesis|uniref:glycosyltransferase family 4 protein n=1 Tax=Puia sp. TaxID=2045100 RepID=UPI002F41D44E
MRVLHIFNEINFSGAEIMYANAAGLFQQKGVELFALSTGANEGNFVHRFREAGIRVAHKPFRRRSLNPFYIWQYGRDICTFIRENRIDVIHIHRSNVFWYFSGFGRLTRRRSVMTLHNVFKAKKTTWLLHYLSRLTARKWFGLTFQSISRSVHDNERDYFKNPTVWINNWFDPERFFPATGPAEKLAARRQIGVAGDAFVVIAVGRCTEIKNHADIIKAVAEVKEVPPLVLVHLGSGHLESAEKQLAADLGIDARVAFQGNRNDVREHLIAADLHVMSSSTEGAPIAALEAMACRLPNILYDNPGMRDLIRNEDTGLLIKPGYRELAESIRRFVKDPGLCAEKGAGALAYVRSEHGRENCVNQIIQLYKANPI